MLGKSSYTKGQLKSFKRDAARKADAALVKGDQDEANRQVMRSRILDAEIKAKG
jgi:hypothetical protein